MEPGQAPPPQKLRYRESNSRIKAIVKDYGNRNTLSYLRRIAHNFRGNEIHPANFARVEASKDFEKQSERIIECFTLCPLRIDDIFAVPVSQFDRRKGYPTNIMGLVLEFDQRSKWK